MAKRSQLYTDDLRLEPDGEPKQDSDKMVEDVTVSDETSYVTVRSLIVAKIIVNGAVTGEQYVFDHVASEVKVAELDANELLAKKRAGCCGGSAYSLFELVD